MGRLLMAFTVTVAALGALGDRAAAAAEFPQGDARRSMGNLGPKQPAPQVPQPTAVPYRGGGDRRAVDRRGPLLGRYRPYLGGAYRPGYRYPPYGYEYDYRYPYPYPPYPYPPYYDPYYVPPLYLPAEALYGPQAVKRFMGWDNWNRPPANVNIIVPPGINRQAGAAKQKKPNLRGTNQRSIALAWKFIGYGDAHFANQKYSDAYQRYRKAVRTAPQLADGYFRQGYALAATGRYDLAARALKRGLGLDPAWPGSDFSNQEVYGDNQMAKKAHLDAMAKAAEEKPNDPDLLFLLGVFLHFEGQPERAAPFFQRAAELAAGDDAHLRAFTGK